MTVPGQEEQKKKVVARGGEQDFTHILITQVQASRGDLGNSYLGVPKQGWKAKNPTALSDLLGWLKQYSFKLFLWLIFLVGKLNPGPKLAVRRAT